MNTPVLRQHCDTAQTQFGKQRLFDVDRTPQRASDRARIPLGTTPGDCHGSEPLSWSPRACHAYMLNTASGEEWTPPTSCSSSRTKANTATKACTDTYSSTSAKSLRTALSGCAVGGIYRPRKTLIKRGGTRVNTKYRIINNTIIIRIIHNTGIARPRIVSYYLST